MNCQFFLCVIGRMLDLRQRRIAAAQKKGAARIPDSARPIDMAHGRGLRAADVAIAMLGIGLALVPR
jgi:hypothetical protein